MDSTNTLFKKTEDTSDSYRILLLLSALSEVDKMFGIRGIHWINDQYMTVPVKMYKYVR